MEEKRKPGRPPNKPVFDQSKPHSTIKKNGGKFLEQDGALFTYAEARGPFIEGIGRLFEPTPKFIEWETDFDIRLKVGTYRLMKARLINEHAQLEIYEQELKDAGYLKEEHGATD